MMQRTTARAGTLVTAVLALAACTQPSKPGSGQRQPFPSTMWPIGGDDADRRRDRYDGDGGRIERGDAFGAEPTPGRSADLMRPTRS